MPNRYTTVNPGTDMSKAINQINQNFAKLDQEVVTKKFGSADNSLTIGKTGSDQLGMVMVQGGKTAVVVGKYRDNRYGLLFYQDGVPTILIGQAPDDGRMGQWQAKDGQNVLTLLGG